MSVALPDARTVARQEAEAIRSAGYDVFERMVQRVMFNAPWLEPEGLLDGLAAFHAERMAKVPSSATYPESPPWVEHVVAMDRELQGFLGLTPRQIAIYRSLSEFLMFRGFARAATRGAEKCRVVYIPETDHGQMHFKNVDDPVPPSWRPRRTRPDALPCSEELVWDGVGSGLHLDDEPDEIFPLPITRMYRHYADDVPSAVEFLRRYSKFFGGGNFVLHDRQKRSVAIEKCSRNFIEVFPPDPVSGFTHCSGMVCRDVDSSQHRYQKAMRDRYRSLFGLAQDGPDATYWNACSRAEEMLVDGMRSMGKTPRCDEVFRLFITPWPEGLNKPGVKIHPDQTVEEYTLVSHGTLIDERVYYRWERDESLRFPTEPEIYQY